MTAKPVVPDVLAARYASPQMATLWSPEQKVVLERRLWLAVLRAQRDLGVDVPDGAVEAYEAVVDKVDLDSIAARERVTRHDVKARIEEFNALAGLEQVHKGMTSRDLTENVEQLQVREGMLLLRDRTVATLVRLADLAVQHDGLVDRRSHPQRPGPGDHAGQAVRVGGRRAPGRVRPADRAARALPAARRQGTGRDGAGPARPARRRRRPARRAGAQRSPPTSASSRS